MAGSKVRDTTLASPKVCTRKLSPRAVCLRLFTKRQVLDFKFGNWSDAEVEPLTIGVIVTIALTVSVIFVIRIRSSRTNKSETTNVKQVAKNSQGAIQVGGDMSGSIGAKSEASVGKEASVAKED